MHRPTWPLTIVPLVALYIAVMPSAVATAAELSTAWAAPPVAAIERLLVAETINDHALTLAFQTTVTTTTTPTPTTPSIVLPRLTPSVTATIDLSPTTSVSDTATLSETAPVTAEPPITLPATVPATTTVGVTATTAVTTASEVLDAEYAGPIEGTIIANRTEANVRFFVEGATYELAPLRSIGLSLPRVTAVLNLFNCDASLPETQEGCFWDPYLLDRESFYEVVSGEAAGLTLQTAGTPPNNQVWLQNRTGKREQVFYGGETYELPPSTVQEFTTTSEDPVLFYLRSCLEVADRSACEWAPNDATPGYYYALVEVTSTGTVPNSRITALQLQPVVSDEGTPPPDTPDAPRQVLCRVQVPVLNVRSGPGLQYQIISKVRSSEQEPATVQVIGRDVDGQWFAVNDQVAPGGWITGSSGFVSCDGDVTELPVAEVTDGRLVPTPAPVAQAAPADPATTTTTTDTQETTVETAPTATAQVQTVPDGQALLVVNNGFDQQVRFTLDQRYRVEVGPSEFDLQPGQSVNVLVYPGTIAFSASSPWRGLSGNQEFVIAEKETRNLWIIFVPDPDGSGRWILQY